MADVFIDKGDAQSAINSYLHMWERIAEILLLLRFLQLQAQSRSTQIGVKIEDVPPEIEVRHESPNELAGTAPHLLRVGTAPAIQIEGGSEPIALPPRVTAALQELAGTNPYLLEPRTAVGQLTGSVPPALLPPLPAAIQPQVLPTSTELEYSKHRILADTVAKLTNAYGSEGHYAAENYTISVDQSIYTICNEEGHEVLVFQVGDNGEYHVIKNDLSFSQEHDIIASRLNIEIHGLDSITSDRTFSEQTQNLGGLAPRGAKAAYIANYLLDGYHTDNFSRPNSKYSISRDADGTLTITRNEDGYCLLKAKDGEILIANLTPDEQQGFSQIYQKARENPAIQKQRPILSSSVSIERE